MPRRADGKRPRPRPRRKAVPSPGRRKAVPSKDPGAALSSLSDLRHRSLQTRELLETARARYVSLFDLAPLGYCLMDEEGVILSINITLASLLGQQRSYLVGLPFGLLVANEDRAALQRYLRDCRASAGEAMACDLILVGSSRVGSLPAHLLTRRIVGRDGQPQLLMAVVDQRDRNDLIDALRTSGDRLRQAASDLERRRVEAEESAARLRGLAREVNRAEQHERQRIARLLHDDLQQLLVSAKMRLHMGGPGPLRREQVEEVGTLIDAAINSSRSLTAQISPPLLQDAGLEPGLRWLARHVHEQHGLSVDLDVRLGGEAMDFSDRDFLFQSAREMLFNVVKHAGVDRATLKASVRGRIVELEVRDRGDGFDPAILDETGGEQRGLRTLRERVALLGGTFGAESSPARGTSVRISFPLCAVEPPRREGLPRPVAPSAAGVHGDRVRVLIADDHRVVREGIESFLRQEDWLQIVGQASDGREAVLMTRDLRPDVVIMDISMPEMNGIEATRIITGENPHVRVIAMSMHQQEDMSAAMLAAGAERYLTKGGPAEDLVRAVKELSTLATPSSPAPGEAESRRAGPDGRTNS